MPIDKLFSGGIARMEQALNLRYDRQGLILSNVANMETPGYTVQDFSFEKAMKKVMDNQGILSRTHEMHLDLDPVDAAQSLEFSAEKRPVDLDEEMVKLAENQMMYEIVSQMIGKKFDGLKYAIDEGGS
ncbi:MAG: flagellar basal-body rod protein FlgB [Desulfobulbaceae bacterium DB1]|nr:MAG: flagellar basal-body rod protein FlgB [Desulfobulbaceae bacterium DB1]